MVQRLKNMKGCCFRDKLKSCFSKKTCTESVVALSKRAQTGKVKVCKVTGNRKICARMASMGLYPGVEADVICSQNGNQCIVKINGGTISIDSDVSENIFVASL